MHYKHDYNRRGRKKPTFTKESSVFLDIPPLHATLDITADATPKKKYNKFLSRLTGIRIICIQQNKVTNDEQEIPNTVATDGLDHARETGTQPTNNENSFKTPTENPNSKSPTNETEYTVDRIE